MIDQTQAREKAKLQNSSSVEAIALEDAIIAASEAGNYSLSHTFPIDFVSTNLKKTLQLNEFTVTVSTAQVLGVAATFTGQATGMTTNVTITADNNGTSGNSISLEFDGVLTVSEALDAWNTANEDNTASLISGDGDQVPDDEETIDLASGVNAVAEIITVGFGPA